MTDHPSPDRYQQIAHLYHQAVELPVEQRLRWLAHVCKDDLALQSEVESLLAADEKVGNFIERPAVEVAAGLLAQESSQTLVGRRVGHYQVLSLLGTGGMGEIWLARDTQLERQVALKLLPAVFTQDAERVRRFMQEAKAASALNHPNIVTVYDIGESEAGRFIVMELVAGHTLRTVIAEDNSLETLLTLGCQIAEALSAAHAAGITHRDIKPDNIMVREDGYVKVLDFGLARLLPSTVSNKEAATLAQQTTPGQLMGTVAYMSPEQARGSVVDTRTDIFSLGVVLYEMFARQQPFTGETASHVIVAILEKDPLPLAHYKPNVPTELERIVRKSLAKDRESRYQTARDLLHDLKALKRELEFDAKPERGSEADKRKPIPVVRRPHETDENESPATTSSTKILIGEIKRHKRGLALTLMVLFFIFIATSYGLYQFIVTPNRESKLAPHITPFTSYPGVEETAVFSPDGNQMAFTWDGGKESEKNEDIYIKLIATDAPLRLTTDPAPDKSPAWSPDGRNIAFLRWSQADTAFGLYLVPALGGTERKLMDGIGEPDSGLNWSPDGEFLALSAKHVPSEPFYLFLLEVKTGEKRRLTFPPAESRGDGYPKFSPDGQTLAFVRWTSTSTADLFLIPRAGGEAKQITFDSRTIRGLTWTADGREIIFASERRGLSSLWRISAAGGEPESLQAVGLGVQFPVISLSGNRLAYQQKHFDPNIWQIELENPAGRKTEPVRLIASTFEDHSPQYSPDGKSIIFSSTRSGNVELWRCKADGTQPLQMTRLDGPLVGTPRWSPDGESIAFDSREGGNADIFLINATGGGLHRFINGPMEEVLPSWSRDGRWLYFCSNRSGRREIWKMPMSGGPPLQLTKQGGFEGFESFDGQWFYFTKGSKDSGIWRIPLEGGEEIAVLPPDKKMYRRNWTLTHQGIYFGSDRTTIEFFNFATGQVRLVATTSRNLVGMVPSFSVDPIGKWLLYTLIEQEGSDIMLMENFR